MYSTNYLKSIYLSIGCLLAANPSCPKKSRVSQRDDLCKVHQECTEDRHCIGGHDGNEVRLCCENNCGVNVCTSIKRKSRRFSENFLKLMFFGLFTFNPLRAEYDNSSYYIIFLVKNYREN